MLSVHFSENKKAWDFFRARSPYHKRIATVYVISPKNAETRTRRLAVLIARSAKGLRFL
jgi:hypothetical protein